MCFLYPSVFIFPLAFVSVNDLLFSGFSLFLFWKCVRFVFVFVVAVSFCCMHLYFMFIALSNHCGICPLFFHLCFMYRHWGSSNKLLDLCACTATLSNIMHRHLRARSKFQTLAATPSYGGEKTAHTGISGQRCSGCCWTHRGQ